MKKLLNTLSLFFLCFLLSCSNSDGPTIYPDVDPEPDSETVIEINLVVDKEAVNIFEIATFSYTDKDGNKIFWGLTLLSVYDSIVWEVPDLGRYKLTEKSADYPQRFHGSITTGWGHNFFTPGKIKSSLLCYKGGKVVYESSNTIQVRNDKDFLCFNWNDITKSDELYTAYTDVFKHEDSDFLTYCSYQDNTPLVTLLYRDTDEKKNNKDRLYKLITGLYGSPKYSDKNQSLLEQKCHELFTLKNNTKPCFIWITRTSKIVLVEIFDIYGQYDEEYDDGDNDYLSYRVYAEPL